VDVELKSSASLAAIPLVVAGTVDSPLIYPSKSAIAGAVAGTALLGPGVGTTLGMKVGSALNRIKESFGSQNR
jgi:CRISPR/Cas system-associated protein Cas5 (RAMP superfamily)